MWVSPNNDEEPGILKAARSIIGSAATTDNRDVLKDIVQFILSALQQAGFDLKKVAGSEDARIKESIIFRDCFDHIGEKAVGPGDLVSYLDATGQATMGLIETYDAEAKIGTMYAMDRSQKEVSSLDFTEADIEGASFLRPKMDLFMGNLAGLFAGMDEDPDENQYMGPSYPSPSP